MNLLLALLLRLDRAGFFLVNVSLANPVFDVLMPWITNLNHWWFVLVAGWCYLFWRGDRQTRFFALTLLLSIGLANLLSSEVLKPLVHRFRPCKTLDGFRLLGHCGGRWGFPSSHAANAAAAGTVLARMFPRWRWAFALL
ncbi:MAG: phosphatase PAP2 family protein, partial [Calditrichaeota bacterium]